MTATVQPALERARASSGDRLPDRLRHELENKADIDLGRVRVHTNGAAAAAATELGARAFALGQDIHFAPGQYDPDSSSGRRLIAHEVAHTIQQRGAPATARAKLQVSQPGDAVEREADTFADAFAEGRPTPTIRQSTAGVIARKSDEYEYRRFLAQTEITKYRYLYDTESPDLVRRKRAPQLPPPKDSAPTEELVRYAKQLAMFQKEWDQLRNRAETEVYRRETRGLNDAEITYLRAKALKRFAKLEAYLGYYAAYQAGAYAHRELLRTKAAIARGGVYGPDPGNPSLSGELWRQTKHNLDPRALIKASLANMKHIIRRSDAIRRQAAARGNYLGASFAAAIAFSESAVDNVAGLQKSIENSLRLLGGARDKAAIEAGKQLVLIGLGGAIARLSPLKLARHGGGSSGFGGKKFAPVPAGAGGMAVAGMSSTAAPPLSHIGIITTMMGALGHGSNAAKKKYRAQQANARANKALAKLDKVTGGHTHERHSATKSDKWLKARALGAEPQPVGPAATKFATPAIHLRTLKLLEGKLADAIENKMAGRTYPANCEIPKARNIRPGKVVTIRRENMGYAVGHGYYSKKGAAKYNVTVGDPTGPLFNATATFRIVKIDANGRPVLHQITAYPELP